MQNWFPSCLGALLALAMACTKANFVPKVDGAAANGGAAGAGGVGAAGGAGGDGSGGGVDSGSDIMVCPENPLVCSGQRTTNPCDPVCQRGGCGWCDQKCSYAGADVHPVCAGQGPKDEFESCTVTHSDLPNQYDDCRPGQICLEPSIGDPTICFKLCYDSSDCVSGPDCGTRKLSAHGGLVSVCDPPYVECGTGACCNPLADTGSGCPATSPFCFLVSPDASQHSRTVCEYSAGSGADSSAPCNSSHDCMTKFTCAEHYCHQVCIPATTSGCPSGEICKAWGTEYGYCTAN